MKTKLSNEQIDEYRTNGVLVYEDLLDETEVTGLIDAITEALETMGSKKVAGESDLNAAEGKKDEYYDAVFLQKLNLWKVSEEVKRVFLGPEIGEMVATLEGVDGMRVWHDQTLQKMPWGNPTAWHLDNPYWSFHSPHAISVWVALDDATVENGCLFYIPGSHTEGRFEKNVEIGQQIGKLFKQYPEWATRTPVSGAMKRGSCGFHNGLTAHGAGANMTPFPRRAMTCGYMPEGSTFNGQKNILPKEYFGTLSIGDPLDSDEQNPIVYRK